MEENVQGPLTEILRDRIREKGSIPFVEFMAACLYEPGLGYYTSPGRKVGAEGDFYTSINVHSLFGRSIAREIVRMWETMGRPTAFTVVEQGAGGGFLACDILDAVLSLAPDFYQALTYCFVEMEPTLREAQRQTLSIHEARLAWATPEEIAAGTFRFSGCLLSNELVDAMPVHLVEMTAEGLREVFVTADNDEFRETLKEPSTPQLASYFQRLGVALQPGQRAEVSLAAHKWLASVAACLDKGYVLTIDYGYEAPEKYGPMRQNGTLLCYWRHTVEEDPYVRPGLQDITSHVDFTMLMEAGKELGLQEIWYGEQYRFLMAVGIMEELMAMEARATSEEGRIKVRLAMKKLILPDGGMGDTFKVLVQAKGVESPALLCLRGGFPL
jgi:SAM-dependent MidA family methyltransferase